MEHIIAEFELVAVRRLDKHVSGCSVHEMRAIFGVVRLSQGQSLTDQFYYPGHMENNTTLNVDTDSRLTLAIVTVVFIFLLKLCSNQPSGISVSGLDIPTQRYVGIYTMQRGTDQIHKCWVAVASVPQKVCIH